MKALALVFALLLPLAARADVTPTAAAGRGAPPAEVKEAPAYTAPSYAVHVVTPDEAAVYNAFLSQAFAPGKADGPLARESVLMENDSLDTWQPRRRAWEAYILKHNGGQGRAADDVLKAFLARPQQVIRFYDLPNATLPVRLVRSDILEGLHKKGGWAAFYDAYPKVQGILSFSSIALGAGGNEALFAARVRCGARCGYRDLVFLRKVNNEWTMIMKDPLP